MKQPGTVTSFLGSNSPRRTKGDGVTSATVAPIFEGFGMTDAEEILELKQENARLQKHNEELAYIVNSNNLGPVALNAAADYCAGIMQERNRL